MTTSPSKFDPGQFPTVQSVPGKPTVEQLAEQLRRLEAERIRFTVRVTETLSDVLKRMEAAGI